LAILQAFVLVAKRHPTLPSWRLLSAVIWDGISCTLNLSPKNDGICMHNLDISISVSEKEVPRRAKAPKVSLTPMISPDTGGIFTLCAWQRL
jgi:hypothetical protein